MTLQQLRYVVEIFHCGSITAAAQKLFVTQPSISRAIRDLESEIGVTILERNPGGVSFTADGLELLVYAKSILEQASSMKMRFLNSKENEMLRLTVSVQHYIFPIDAMINFVNQRLAETPSFTINLRDGNTSQVVKDVLFQHSKIGVLYISNATSHFMHQLFQKTIWNFIQWGHFPLRFICGAATLWLAIVPFPLNSSCRIPVSAMSPAGICLILQRKSSFWKILPSAFL